MSEGRTQRGGVLAEDTSIIVIGGSAGAIEALERIVSNIPAGFHAPIIVVVHISPHARSVLPLILERAGHLPAHHVEKNEALTPGHIYVAPPNRHIAVDEAGNVCLLDGARINRNRPSIDPLFISAARAYGAGVTGVLLSGYLDDGVAGLTAIEEAGGTVIVQDPETTIHQDMPLAAIARVTPDHILGPEQIGAELMRIAAASAERGATMTNGTEDPGESRLSLDELTTSSDTPVPQPTTDLIAMSCPDCGGVLQAVDGPDPERFRCRVGHAFSIDSLYDAKTQEIETALWTAIRALEEKAEMSKSLARRLGDRGALTSSQRYAVVADTMNRDARMLRAVLSQATADPGMSES